MRKAPNPIDCYVGSRIRAKRNDAGLSQEALAAQLGLTFQQIQKYEKGANRVSASRLQLIATLLKTPISYFFDGASTESVALADAIPMEQTAEVSQFMTTSDGVRLVKALLGIANSKTRRRVIDLVEALADQSESVIP
jgi:transcriptional regulator with XRE-family HTH domain